MHNRTIAEFLWLMCTESTGLSLLIIIIVTNIIIIVIIHSIFPFCLLFGKFNSSIVYTYIYI